MTPSAPASRSAKPVAGMGRLTMRWSRPSKSMPTERAGLAASDLSSGFFSSPFVALGLTPSSALVDSSSLSGAKGEGRSFFKTTA